MLRKWRSLWIKRVVLRFKQVYLHIDPAITEPLLSLFTTWSLINFCQLNGALIFVCTKWTDGVWSRFNVLSATLSCWLCQFNLRLNWAVYQSHAGTPRIEQSDTSLRPTVCPFNYTSTELQPFYPYICLTNPVSTDMLHYCPAVCGKTREMCLMYHIGMWRVNRICVDFLLIVLICGLRVCHPLHQHRWKDLIYFIRKKNRVICSGLDEISLYIIIWFLTQWPAPIIAVLTVHIVIVLDLFCFSATWF